MEYGHQPWLHNLTTVLSAAQGVPYQEIAAIVDISPNAAATRISPAISGASAPATSTKRAVSAASRPSYCTTPNARS